MVILNYTGRIIVTVVENESKGNVIFTVDVRHSDCSFGFLVDPASPAGADRAVKLRSQQEVRLSLAYN